MDEKALKEKIKLLEQVIELQKQLLEHVQKVHAQPVYVPYIQPPLYDPWRPYYYEQRPYTIVTSSTSAGDMVGGSGLQ